ncbi:Serine/threonine-protein kinase DCLK3 [Gracilariopsis chorda]|uniref:Serine/threonine-protein kinase DCLK3 n=1 Tax=Gracilariopsis chorda TaxID=448386 RepID=A0A2V3IRM4_9FLOR|nr:Serine/threonine-protein kinase DCLK3 [Gracilariopsis chorda]|eukprot:PXF44772.1 Serine/threonine-protein kinase DCLK3 [Gracilariopsis chorda]
MPPRVKSDPDAKLLLAHHADATSPLRYTAVNPLQVEGWLAKEGRSLRTRRNRYFTLNGSVLASHRVKTGPPSWHVSLTDALVEPGAQPREIRISLPTRALSFIAPTHHAFQTWIVSLRRASLPSTRVDDYYRIGRLLGEGMNGQVRLAHDKMTDEPVAIKMVPRLGRENETHFLAREVQIILSLSHPNIVRTIDVFVRTRRIHFVMEYLSGGELFDFIAQNTHFTETHAAAVMTDLLNALHYLHSRNIVHRDVKLENLLCANSTWPLNVKLADFGFANYLNASNHPTLRSFVGTPYYIAPEMLRGDPHGCPVDVWAGGVVMYILLSGKFPFGGNNESEYYQRVLSKQAYFPSEEWGNVSEDAKNLVRGMLCKDPRKRLTVEQCLRHPWLARAQPVLDSPQRPTMAPERLLTAEPILQTATVLRHNRTKRGKWRNLGMLNRSLSGSPEALLLDNLSSSEHGRVKAMGSESSATRSARSPGNDGPGKSATGPDGELVHRRPSLIRRIISSQKISLDRYDGPVSAVHPVLQDKLDEASANPRKTMSLFSKDGPLRRSFHRVADRPTEDAINFVNSQSQRLPPKIARERQRQQKQAEAAKRASRTRFFGSCRFPAPDHSAEQGYHSSPRLQSHLLQPLQAFITPSSSEHRPTTTYSKLSGVNSRLSTAPTEDTSVASDPPLENIRRNEELQVVHEDDDEVIQCASADLGLPAAQLTEVRLMNMDIASSTPSPREDHLHGPYSRGRAIPLRL